MALLPTAHPSLPSLAQPLHPLFEQLMHRLMSYTALTTSQRSAITGPSFLSSYASLVTVLVQQLTRFLPTAPSNAGHSYVYNSLWMCV